MPQHQQFSIPGQVTARNTRAARLSTRHTSTQTICNSTRQANQHHATDAGESAGQPPNRVFERYKITGYDVIAEPARLAGLELAVPG
jgi:hypothetical protein